MHHHKNDIRLWLGLIAFVSGSVLMLEQLELIPAETWNYVWPAVLVVFGVKLMVEPSCCEHKEAAPNKKEMKLEEEAVEEKAVSVEKKSKKKKKK